MLVVLAAGFVLLAYRLVRVQTVDAVHFQELARGQQIGTIPVPALRGSILDTHGQILAASVSMPSIAVDPSMIQDRVGTAFILANALNVQPTDLYPALRGKGTFAWLARKVSPAAADRVSALNVRGVFVTHEPSGKRLYPKGRLAAHVLGFTGIDDNGLDGVEASFDRVLRGQPGELRAEMDRDGRALPDGWKQLVPARPGNTLMLTIDETIQYAAERELMRCVQQHSAKSGSALVLDVPTGDVLAMANYPDYDPAESSHTPPESLRNRAITDAYEPGSTFKVFVGAAAYDSGKVDPFQTFYSGASITVGGWTIRNANDGFGSANGSENVKGILTYSYNTGAASVGLYLGRDIVGDYLQRFGFGRFPGLPLPGEACGILPPVKEWKDVNLATISFGQGLTVTPLQLACAMQAIANKGIKMRPRIVKAILDDHGTVVKSFPPKVDGHPIAAPAASLMVAALRNVVVEGTGKKAEIPGFPVAGKTGTAQVVDHGVYASGRYIASFLGFLPVQDPRVVLLIKIEEPQDVYWGGSVAAPLFHDIGETVMRHLEVAPVPVATATASPSAQPTTPAPVPEATTSNTPAALNEVRR